MALMKEMVEDAMCGPLEQNEQEVAWARDGDVRRSSKCLNNDIETLKREETSLRQQLDTGEGSDVR